MYEPSLRQETTQKIARSNPFVGDFLVKHYRASNLPPHFGASGAGVRRHLQHARRRVRHILQRRDAGALREPRQRADEVR